LTITFAFASLFGYISGSSFALQSLFGLSVTQYSVMFALDALGMIMLGLLNARLVRRFAVRTLLLVVLVGSCVAAAVLVGVVALTSLGVAAVLPPLFVVVATRGLVSANATVLGIERASAAGTASAVLGACMFAAGILVSPLLALGGAGTAVRARRCGHGGADGRGSRGWGAGRPPGHDPNQPQPGCATSAPNLGESRGSPERRFADTHAKVAS
jgi:DHA1 family bicyclomycin/chloramphenicol resistance-like MFS transporter